MAVVFFYITAIHMGGHSNVLLITIDALRADHLGCYGYKRNTSPTIDLLAKKGLLFQNAIAQSTHTPPCMGTIATSAYAPTHQLYAWGKTLKPSLPTLAETLRNNGYATFFIGGNGNFKGSLHNFTHGFDIFDDVGESAARITAKACALIRTSNQKPFFLWMHYMDVHNYDPEPGSAAMYTQDQYYNNERTLPIVPCVMMAYGINGIPECLAVRKGMRQNPDYYIAQYDAAIHDVDEQIKILLQHTPKNTLVIITADHGELLGERGYFFHHGRFLYRPLLNIPLIIKYPQNRVAQHTISSPVSANLDIAPTIVKFLGITAPSTFEGLDLRSVASSQGSLAQEFIFSQAHQYKECVQNNEWKLIVLKDSNKLLLSNVRNNPNETPDISHPEPAALNLLKTKLFMFQKAHPYTRSPETILTDETAQKLKSLGYLQ
ncbi:MAG: sulfatase [Candidatus Omnitrophica bacterium]|nr:sulfatase [Candidatus Omnitrophota bacterium]